MRRRRGQSPIDHRTGAWRITRPSGSIAAPKGANSGRAITASAAASQFLATCSNAAEHFADAVEAADDANAADPQGPARLASVEAAEDVLQRALQGSMQRLSNEIDAIITTQMQDLRSEMLEIDSGPSAQYISSMAGPVVEMPDGPNVPSYTKRSPETSSMRLPSWLPDAQEMLGNFAGFWGAGQGMKSSSGTTGHRIVLEVGDLLGKKFKPWGAVKIANGIGKVDRFLVDQQLFEGEGHLVSPELDSMEALKKESSE
jgi:hypothetical protein